MFQCRYEAALSCCVGIQFWPAQGTLIITIIIIIIIIINTGKNILILIKSLYTDNGAKI